MEPNINSGSLTYEQLLFNACHCGARVVVEHTYGWLKGRWWCLRNQMNISVWQMCKCSGACGCWALHNICQAHGEAFNDTWLNCGYPAAPALCDNTDSSPDEEIVRRAIKQYSK